MNKKELICYETDASRLKGKAEKVVFPKTSEEIQTIVKTSNLDIVPRGSGTGLVGGCVPDNSIVVDMSKMNKLIDIDKVKNTILVEAGISFKELNGKLDAMGFEFPVQPLNQSSAIGSMIALNIACPRSIKYGRMKNWVEEIEFINGRGELMKLGKADLSDVCGMEGITGIIVRAKLKISPEIKRSASVFQTNDLNEALKIARRLRLEKDIVMLEFFSKQISKILNLPEKYHLIAEFDSTRGKIKDKDYEKTMELRQKVYHALGKEQYYNSEDPKFFFDKLGDFISYLEINQIPYFGYLGTGMIHPFFRDDEEDKRQETLKIIKKMNGKLVRYGIGIKRKDFLDNFEKKIIQRIKMRHDPFGKLNKGKIIDYEGKIDEKKPAKHLKPLQEEEIEEIKPFLGEKISASKIKQEKGDVEPEKQMDEFIEKVELLEGEAEKDKPEKEIGKPTDPAQELIKDYEYTFESELSDPKKTKIEEFAKDVPKKIIKEEELKGKLSKEEKEMIDKLIMNRFKEEEEGGEGENK